MFPRIVVATDMSEYAGRAARRAAMLARDLCSKSLDLLHVIDALALENLRQLAWAPLDMEQRLMQSSHARMTEIERELSESYGVAITSTTLNVGRPSIEIARYAHLVDAGLTVIGAHGGGFVRDVFIGSTVDKVMGSLNCPLLIVRQEPRVAYRRILAPVDFSEYSRRAVDMALKIAAEPENITLLHAFEMPFESRLELDEEQVRRFREEMGALRNRAMDQFVLSCGLQGVSMPRAIEWGDPLAVIRGKAEDLESDLIIIGKHGQSGWADRLLGTVAKKIVQNTSCDVLVVGQGEAPSRPV